MTAETDEKLEAMIAEIEKELYSDGEPTRSEILAALREVADRTRRECAESLTTEQRQELYTLMGQWSRNTDLQFQQVANWIDKRAAALLGPPKER